MIQQLLVGLFFLGAVGFLVVLVIRNFRANRSCATGCGKCGVAVDPVPLKPKP